MQMNFWLPERQAEQMRLHCGTGFLPLAALLRENDIWQVDAAGESISPSTVGEIGPHLNHRDTRESIKREVFRRAQSWETLHPEHASH